MAKTKKFKRRRVGASKLNPKSPLVMLGVTAVGYFLADTINEQIDKLLPAPAAPAAVVPAVTSGMDPKTQNTVVMAAELGLGGFLLLKGKSSLIKTAAGGLLAGAGLKRALVSAGVIKGYNVNGYRVNGYQAVPVIGGYQSVPVIGNRRAGAIPGQLQGIPTQLSGRLRVMGGIGQEHTEGSGSGIMGASGCMQ